MSKRVSVLQTSHGKRVSSKHTVRKRRRCGEGEVLAASPHLHIGAGLNDESLSSVVLHYGNSLVACR